TFYTQGFDPGRYRPEPLGLLPVGATVTGWDTFLPQDSRALVTAHAKKWLKLTPMGQPSISVNLRRIYALQTPEMPVPISPNRQKIGLPLQLQMRFVGAPASALASEMRGARDGLVAPSPMRPTQHSFSPPRTAAPHQPPE